MLCIYLLNIKCLIPFKVFIIPIEDSIIIIRLAISSIPYSLMALHFRYYMMSILVLALLKLKSEIKFRFLMFSLEIRPFSFIKPRSTYNLIGRNINYHILIFSINNFFKIPFLNRVVRILSHD